MKKEEKSKSKLVHSLLRKIIDLTKNNNKDALVKQQSNQNLDKRQICMTHIRHISD